MVEVANLTKIYGKHRALDDVSFKVDEGEILGFLGPNGAGKTTTMNIMTGYIASTSGTVLIDGVDIVDEPERAKSKIGYLPETPPVYGDMRVFEYLNFVAAIKKVKSAERKKMIADIAERVHIAEMSQRLIKNLSKGYRQRVGLAQAMIGDPKVIILDEPTVGLDPKQIIEMREVIRNLGRTVILSSHIMQEVSAVCDRVMIINKGRILATPETLSSAGNGRIAVRVRATQSEVFKALKNYDTIKETKELPTREEGTLELELIGEENSDIRETVFKCMAENNFPILMMKSADLSLEDIFLQITAGNMDEVSETETETETQAETEQ
ncbi:MAG: ABC transporter ATP-binding protein [Turicibacter sp.]|nr:ABC transporter ATP-binding protein [Turicibacter sp.]